jgi:coenzyme PQQ precursor peptide PqqA
MKCRRFGQLSDFRQKSSSATDGFGRRPNSRPVTDATHASIRRLHLFALSKSEVALTKREVPASDASVCRQHRMFRACATFEVNLVSMPVRTSCQQCLGETLMSWKTPKIVEVPVGMEINMYACAARQ